MSAASQSAAIFLLDARRPKPSSLSEVYDHADQLAELRPQNHHIHDKIRQQLQVLRDMDLLEFLGGASSLAAARGSYRLT